MRFFSSSKMPGHCGAVLGALLLALVAPRYARAQGTAIVPTYTQTLQPTVVQTLCKRASLNSSGTLIVKNANDAQDQGSHAQDVDRVALLKFDLSQVKAPIVSARLLFDGFLYVDPAFPNQPAPSSISTQVSEATNWPSSPSFSALPATGSGTSVSVVRNASNPKLNGPTMHFGPDETQVVSNAITKHPTWVGWVWKNSNGTPHTHSDYLNPVLELTFNKKVWTVDNGILGGDLVKPAVQQGPLTQVLTVEQGASLDVELSGASDTDHWALSGKEGDEDDKTLTYKWTADAGQFSSPDSATSKWTAPLLPPGVGSMTITITGEVKNDNPPPFGPDETGKRKDDAVTHSFTVIVKRPTWKADPAMGQHRDPNTQQLVPDGRMTAPQDQTGNYDSTQEVSVGAGARVLCAVETATDLDTLTPVNGDPSEVADEVNYSWSVENTGGTGSNGHFEWQTTDENGQTVTKTGDTAPTAKATWVASSDLTSDSKFILKCTIDDKPGAINSPAEGGKRDDDALVRNVSLKGASLQVKFEGQLIQGNSMLRGCAGGIDDHAATDPNPDPTKRNNFQYRAHTRQVDLTLTKDGNPLPNTTFTLKFDGNQGHDYGDGREKKTARLHNVSDPFDSDHPWVETLDVTTNADGKASVWVLSSDVISQPKLQAVQKIDPNQEPVKLGELSCDFAAPTSKRRFQDLAGDDPNDNGWLFYYPKQNDNPDDLDSNFLADPGDTMPAKIYLKFKVDESQPDDYVDEHGRGNWQYVNSHNLTLNIESINVASSDDEDVVDDSAGGVDDSPPPGNEPYLDPDPSPIPLPDGEWQDPDISNPGDEEGSQVSDDDSGVSVQDTNEITSSVEVDGGGTTAQGTTNQDGATQCLLRAKSRIGRAKKIVMAAVDGSTWSQ